MRLDWIFLPRENPCAKFYIILIIIIVVKNNNFNNSNFSINSRTYFIDNNADY